MNDVVYSYSSFVEFHAIASGPPVANSMLHVAVVMDSADVVFV